jgi:hypothetical protein
MIPRTNMARRLFNLEAAKTKTERKKKGANSTDRAQADEAKAMPARGLGLSLSLVGRSSIYWIAGGVPLRTVAD